MKYKPDWLIIMALLLSALLFWIGLSFTFYDVVQINGEFVAIDKRTGLIVGRESVSEKERRNEHLIQRVTNYPSVYLMESEK